MTKDEIIRMAVEAGFAFDTLGGTYTTGSLNKNLEAFANLVAAHERGRNTKLLIQMHERAALHHGYYMHAAIEINRKAAEAVKEPIMTRFEITVAQTVVDGEALCRATAAEFPHLASYGATAQIAHDDINEDIDALELMSKSMGHSFPDPRSQS